MTVIQTYSIKQVNDLGTMIVPCGYVKLKQKQLFRGDY